MKQRLFFNVAERGLILTAMKSYIRNAEDPRNPLFKMTLKKIEKNHVLSLDGMEMICLVMATRWRSMMFMEMGKRAEQIIYLNLSNTIDEIREEFQYQNAPELIKAARVAPLAAI